jgi:hypothetical protein
MRSRSRPRPSLPPRTDHRRAPRILGPLGALALAGSLGVAGCAEDLAPAETCEPAAGRICTWAGSGLTGFNGEDQPLLEARFYWPVDVTFTESGPYIVDWNNHRIRHVTEEGTLRTVIGTDFIGDGPANLADLTDAGAPGTSIALNHPTQIVELPDGDLMLVSWHNHKLRRFDPETGLARVVCGIPDCDISDPNWIDSECPFVGFSGDGGPPANALLNQPSALTIAPDGSYYLLDQRNQRIRRITGFGDADTIQTVMGTGTVGFSGDGGSPMEATVHFPPGSNPPPNGGLAFDEAGRLYFADTGNSRLRRIDFEADLIETVIGDGTTEALNNPRDVERGPDGRIYVADEMNHRILALDPETLDVEVVAGTGVAGFSGDGGPGNEAQLDRPAGIAFDDDGNLYVSDTFNQRVRVIYAGE